MKKLLWAVAAAMVLVTGAQAATVEQDTAVTNGFIFKTGNTAYVGVGDPGYNPATPDQRSVFQLGLTIQDATQTVTLIRSGQLDPKDYSFTFDWIFAPGTERKLTISGVLRSWTKSYMNDSAGNTAGGSTSGIVHMAGATFSDEIIGPFTTLFTTGGKETAGTGDALTQLADTNPTPVPIGGTLPLLLTAVGVGAAVMRRRAKSAALV